MNALATTSGPALPIREPGFYRMRADTYHGDPVVEPSLSWSIAHTMLSRSPRHAWFDHPRLNAAWSPMVPTQAMQDGTLLHKMLLGSGPTVALVDAPDWRSDKAKRAWHHADASGLMPVLKPKWRKLLRVAAAARRELRQWTDAPVGLENGFAESVLVWREGSTWCRAMCDWLVPQPGAPILDFKFVTRAAPPEEWRKSFAANGYDGQAEWYRRGFRAVFGFDAGPFVFVTVETEPPFGVSVVSPGFDWIELGAEKVKQALEIWAACRMGDVWPGYARRVAFLDAPRFAVDDWQDKAGRAVVQMGDLLPREQAPQPLQITSFA